MAKDGSGIEKRLEAVMPKDAPPNGDAPTDDNTGDVPVGPRRRVSEMQAKLHRWAVADPGRRFDDLFNLVHDPATLMMAWDRVATNRGAKTAGSDVTPHTFRKTVATLIDRLVDSDTAARVLGHSSDTITKEFYIEKDRSTPEVTHILQSFAGKPASTPLTD